jgi:hypothetical protein
LPENHYLCEETEKKNRYMKRLIYLLAMLVAPLSLHAQTETDTRTDGPGVKDFGGFILDMGTMLNSESLVVDAPFLPSLLHFPAMEQPDMLRIQPEAFRINPDVTFTGGLGGMRSLSSYLSVLHPGVGSGLVNWQGASYKLDNGMRINLYGEYDADGNKVFNPAAMPWQRNNFNAAFEMKSANGNFGIKVEVHGGRNNPY